MLNNRLRQKSRKKNADAEDELEDEDEFDDYVDFRLEETARILSDQEKCLDTKHHLKYYLDVRSLH